MVLARASGRTSLFRGRLRTVVYCSMWRADVDKALGRLNVWGWDGIYVC